ncbi:alpha/beta fold hydrolase [Actinomycetospora flava]|uniref:Alpha/beta hydrolase n=1 Tax=Actinomycetospora flava TaxID=3129232 RepID=A0ABU8ME19_9PSEU
MDAIAVNGVELAVRTTGDGPLLVLVHGFPHTGAVWSQVAAAMSVDHRVVVPDLRGFGASTRTAEGLDADTLSRDLEELIGTGPATVVAIDAAVPPAFLLGLRRPDLLTRLVLVEATLGSLPGAEAFAAGGPPWWFGFHQVPGLAERVLAGHEDEYVGWFYDQGTRHRGVRPDLRAELGAAFAEPGALACALGYYRALPESDRQLHDAVARARLAVPTTAIGAAPVGRALEVQLAGVADDLTGHLIEDCGHIVPVDRPDALVALLRQDPTVTVTAPGSAAS